MSYGGLTFPMGFGFRPYDDELVHYLQKKNRRMDSHNTAIFPEIDMSKHEPRDLPALVLVLTRAEFLEWFNTEWYFFSPRVFKHSTSKSTKIDRTTNEGSWKKQGVDRRITGACSDKQIGGKRILTFYLSKKQKTDWVIHEYYLTKADSDEQMGDFVLCRLKDNSLKKKKSGKSDHDRQDAPFCNEDQASSELGNVVEHGGGSCSMALNAENPASNSIPYGNDGGGMRTEAEEYQGCKELYDALFESDGNDQELKGSQTGPCYDNHDLSVYVEGQPDSEMVEERIHEPGALHPPPTTQLQSPIYTKLGTNNFIYDEYRKRKYPFGDSDPSLMKKNHTDEVNSNTSTSPENQAADVNPEGYSQPGGNLGSDLFWSQELPSINREPRDLPHDKFIEWDDLPPIIEGFESSLAHFSDTVIDGGISDRNVESAYGSANDYFALAIGATLQCS